MNSTNNYNTCGEGLVKVSRQVESVGRRKFRIAEMKEKGNPGEQKGKPKPGSSKMHCALSEK